MMPRQTHTVVQLEVPLTFWQFVQQKFIDAGYQHAFGSDSGSEPFIDMSGVAITPIPDKPIDMVLHCPACFAQHIDEPEMCEDEGCDHHGEPHSHPGDWSNPPHRSHQCRTCGYIWRPADVCTNGVEKVKTVGKADSTEEDRKRILKSIAGTSTAVIRQSEDGAYTVCRDVYWRYDPAPRSTKIFLLNSGGVAIAPGPWSDGCIAWHPLFKRDKDEEARRGIT